MPKQCTQCGKTLNTNKFHSKRGSEELYDICDPCMNETYDPFNIIQVMKVFEMGDRCFIEPLWVKAMIEILNKNNNYKALKFSQILGHYCRLTNQRRYQSLGFNDSEEAFVYRIPEEGEQRLQLRRKLCTGLITTDQYLAQAELKPVIGLGKNANVTEVPTIPIEEIRLEAILARAIKPITTFEWQFLKNYGSTAPLIPQSDGPYLAKPGERPLAPNNIEIPKNTPSTFSWTETLSKINEQRSLEDKAPSLKKLEQLMRQNDTSTTQVPATAQSFNNMQPLTSTPIQNIPQSLDEEILAELTEEEKRELRLKWGEGFSPQEWVRMENLYSEYKNEYSMNIDREETLRQICKTSVKMDAALEQDDIKSYQLLASVLANLRKSGRFTDEQRIEHQSSQVNCVGALVAKVEEVGGIIEPFTFPQDFEVDKVDATLQDMQSYTYSLVKNEMGLGDLIERYIAKLEKAEELDREQQEQTRMEVENEEMEAELAANEYLSNLEEKIEKEMDEFERGAANGFN